MQSSGGWQIHQPFLSDEFQESDGIVRWNCQMELSDGIVRLQENLIKTSDDCISCQTKSSDSKKICPIRLMIPSAIRWNNQISRKSDHNVWRFYQPSANCQIPNIKPTIPSHNSVQMLQEYIKSCVIYQSLWNKN